MCQPVLAKIVGSGAIGNVRIAGTTGKPVFKQKNLSVTNGIAPFVGDHAGNDRATRKRESHIFGILTGAGDDGGAEPFVLMETLIDVAGAAGGQNEFPSGEISEEEASIRGSDRSEMHLTIGGRNDVNSGAIEGLSGKGVDDHAADAVAGVLWRGEQASGGSEREQEEKDEAARHRFSPPALQVRGGV